MWSSFCGTDHLHARMHHQTTFVYFDLFVAKRQTIVCIASLYFYFDVVGFSIKLAIYTSRICKTKIKTIFLFIFIPVFGKFKLMTSTHGYYRIQTKNVGRNQHIVFVCRFEFSNINILFFFLFDFFQMYTNILILLIRSICLCFSHHRWSHLVSPSFDFE